MLHLLKIKRCPVTLPYACNYTSQNENCFLLRWSTALLFCVRMQNLKYHCQLHETLTIIKWLCTFSHCLCGVFIYFWWSRKHDRFVSSLLPLRFCFLSIRPVKQNCVPTIVKKNHLVICLSSVHSEERKTNVACLALFVILPSTDVFSPTLTCIQQVCLLLLLFNVCTH